MPLYQPTTKRRYMWGIGVTCSVFLITLACSWAFEGKVTLKVRSLSGENTTEFRQEDRPGAFWSIVGCSLVGGVAGVVITGIGLSRVRKQEQA